MQRLLPASICMRLVQTIAIKNNLLLYKAIDSIPLKNGAVT